MRQLIAKHGNEDGHRPRITRHPPIRYRTRCLRDAFRAARLQSLARVIFITLDGPVRDDVLEGAHMPGLQAAVRKEGVALTASASIATASSPLLTSASRAHCSAS